MVLKIPSVLPILILPPNQVLFPSLIVSIQLVAKESLELLKAVLRDASESSGSKALIVGLAPYRESPLQKEGDEDDKLNKLSTTENVCEFATACRVIRLERLAAGGGFLAICEGLSRIHIESFTQTLPYFEANVTIQEGDTVSDSTLLPLLSTTAIALLTSLTLISPLPKILAERLQALALGLTPTNAGTFVDTMIATIPISSVTGLSFQDKLAILSIAESTKRIAIGIQIFSRVQEVLSMQKRIGDKVGESLSRRQREFLLRQQMEAIKSELAGLTGGVKQEQDNEDDGDDMKDLEKRIKEKDFGTNLEVSKVVRKEFNRLKKQPPGGAESGVIRNYLDWLLILPWNDSTPLEISRDFITAARARLDSEHEGLEKVKRRLIEYLAVLKLKQQKFSSDHEPSSALVDGTPNDSLPLLPINESITSTKKEIDNVPILCLSGPPGVGKTSIARSLAGAMGRKFYRISLGGVRDSAEIRGFKRTYVGALPGALVVALKNVGVNNPVILLDEIDKLGTSSQGDPAAVLLEALDPVQNFSFSDHYLGVPLDLSKVLFIATANSLDTIPGPLFDRMEVIELSGYVHEEKLTIARKYLIPKQLRANSLPPSLFRISDAVLLHLITAYSFEAGVRGLERELSAVIRAKTVEYSEALESSSELNVVSMGYKIEVTLEELERILGAEKYQMEAMDRESSVGVATGLAFMGSGNGGILHIESSFFPGSGALKLTGSLGPVITESAQLSFAWVKSHAYELELATSNVEDIFKSIDLHVHIPSGSIKKDGPSAGVAITIAIVSLFRKIKVIEGLAVTGEITLRGQITPVGGIKEKLLGAHRAGIRTIILPWGNRKDVSADLPISVTKDLKILYVRTVWEALEIAFGRTFEHKLMLEAESRL